jgi:uncharacterized protein YjiS (DUF1127 family)
MAMSPTLPARPGILALLRNLPQLIALRRDRNSLAQLDTARLRDIGLTPDAARAESTRSFWDAPDHWLL